MNMMQIRARRETDNAITVAWVDRFKELRVGTRLKFVDDKNWWIVDSLGKIMDNKYLYNRYGKSRRGDSLCSSIEIPK